MATHPELALFFLVIAFIYASVGFGGGSSYLAVLALYALPVDQMKLTALVCNIVVVSGGTWILASRRQLNWKRSLPVVLAGLPMAFLGGRITLSQHVFFVLLGASLLAAAALLWLRKKDDTPADAEMPRYGNTPGIAMGAAIGLLSGMVGIGGGIFLSPLLNLLRWDTPKKIAGTASLYILVNSVSGIAGQLSRLPGAINYGQVGMLAAAVLVGGQLGSRLGAMRFPQLLVRRLTALLVFVAGAEVLYKHLFR